MKTIRTFLFTCAFCALAAAPAFAGQEHMNAALEHLRAAKMALEKAEHDKGGHREEALAAVDRAIHQVEEGIRVGRHR